MKSESIIKINVLKKYKQLHQNNMNIPSTNGILDFFIVNSVQSHIIKQELDKKNNQK